MAKAGQTFIIEISGNITTGFIWRQAKDNDCRGIVKFLDEEYKVEESKKNLSGAPGKYYFRFQAVKPGECALRFEHLRPWEEETGGKVETRKYLITVE